MRCLSGGSDAEGGAAMELDLEANGFSATNSLHMPKSPHAKP